VPIPAEVYQQRHLLPSILSADFARLGDEIATVMDAGVRLIHVDVMDGHFVPNITIGAPVVKAIGPLVHSRSGYMSVHLMIERPEDYVEDFAEAGADALSVHVETSPHLYRTLQAVKALGVGAGVAINPGTPIDAIDEVIPLLDFVVVMTVNPGFGGQTFIEPVFHKVPELRRLLPEHIAIEIDGGITLANIERVVAAGANWVVAGSAVFGAGKAAEEARALQAIMARAGVLW